MCIRDRYYYEALGADRIKALNYKEKKLLNEIHIMKTKNKIRHELHGIIHIGDRILTTDIQQTLHDVYDRLEMCIRDSINPIYLLWCNFCSA